MMKYTLHLSAFWLSIFIFTSCGNPGQDGKNNPDPDGNAGITDTLGSAGNPGDSSLIIVMDRMIDQMTKMSLSEHFDVHFAKLMSLHHQGAIDMARIEMTKGKDAKLVALAKSIIERKTNEMESLKSNVSHHKPKAADDVSDEELKDSISKMMTGMKDIQIKGNTDKEFAQMMILHLQCAIEMSAQEVIQGHHVQLKLMARDMIGDDKKALEEMKEWLSNSN